ncbi:MAG: heat-inducible transcription repressor HrcA [Chloroflexi bacterium]|jgi:heat-inducible transcriptional repressor|nr:heat-inducible transcription repressor HrcA [Chloroflexota bacterium]
MAELTKRQKFILALVIRDYIESAQPVGSRHLMEKYSLDVSPATIRNEMMVLTEMGLLRQPHTSAGRVPTEDGYRYFVRQLMGHTELPGPVKRTIIHQFYQAGIDMESWLRLAASILAHQSQAASLVTSPRTERSFFKHIELISTRGRQVLMVLVLAGGEVRQQMLVLAEQVTQEQLSAAARELNEHCKGKDADSIAALAPQLGPLEQDILRLAVDEMRRSSDLLGGEVYRDGLSHVLAEPEFSEVEVARNALRIFEERTLLEDLLSRTIQGSEPGMVQVLIGGEGTWEELREFSMVLARYGVPGLITGTVGVLGPIRMPYGRTISTVRFVAGILSDMVVETQSE